MGETREAPDSRPGCWYVCEACGGRFRSAVDAEAARAEAEAVFGGPAPDDAAMVCEVCYESIMEAGAEAGLPVRW